MSDFLVHLCPCLALVGILIACVFGPMSRKPWLMFYGLILIVMSLVMMVVGIGLRDGWL